MVSNTGAVLRLSIFAEQYSERYYEANSTVHSEVDGFMQKRSRFSWFLMQGVQLHWGYCWLEILKVMTPVHDNIKPIFKT